jgi:hypothetical protein
MSPSGSVGVVTGVLDVNPDLLLGRRVVTLAGAGSLAGEDHRYPGGRLRHRAAARD